MKEAILDNKGNDHKPIVFSDVLWVLCKRQASELSSKDSSAEARVNQFSQKTGEIDFITQQFTEYLRGAYLLDALGHWIKGISAMDPFWQEKYRKGMKS